MRSSLPLSVAPEHSSRLAVFGAISRVLDCRTANAK